MTVSGNLPSHEGVIAFKCNLHPETGTNYGKTATTGR